jgi:hypothetical protein
VSKPHKSIFDFDTIIQDADLFESFYPTQAYIIYKITKLKIPVYNIKSVNHFMPCALKYEDKLFAATTSLKNDIDIIASHGITHFSGFHKHRSKLHEEVNDLFHEIFDQKITLVIMNFSRPDNIKNKLLPFYTKIPAVSQIVISHCKERSKFEYASTKDCEIIHRNDVELDKKFGLFTRYIASESSKNDCVVFIDDDLIIPAHALAQIYVQWRKNPMKVVGTRGRTILKVGNNWLYDSSKYVTNADIILTHCAMTSKKLMDIFLTQEKYFHDLAMTSVVPWNGEDLALSLFAKFLNQDENISLHSKCIDLDAPDSVSSTVDHNIARDRMVDYICKFYTNKLFKSIIL